MTTCLNLQRLSHNFPKFSAALLPTFSTNLTYIHTTLSISSLDFYGPAFMTFKSHGAPRSFKIHGNKRISRLHFLSGPMKPLHSAAAAAAGAHAVVVGGGGIRSSQGGRLFSSSSASSLSTISLKYNTTLKPKMDSPSSPPKTWHPSLGIVFAGESRNASCRPLMARNFTSQVAVVSSSSDTLGSLLETQAPPPPGTGNGGNHKPGGDSVNVTTTLADAQEARPEVKEEATQEPKEEAGDENAIPPYTPLEFKIPQDLFRKAKKAAKGTPESYWNYSLYRRPTEETDIPSKVKVHYCKSNHTTERVLKQYFAHEKILGFDLEWDPHAWKYAAAENKPGASASRAARRNVSVLQLASESRIGIFHLALFPKGESLVTPTMRKIMEDPEIIKLGVHIKGDTSRLQKYLKVQSRGTFELSHLYKLVKYSARGEYGEINRSLVSLANQVGDVLGLPLFKGEDVRTSDWTKQLTMEQIVYGASDAYAAVQIFAVLNHQREKLNPVPPLPAYAELNKPIRLGEGIVVPRKVPAAVPPAAEDCGDVLPPAEDEITDESGLSVKTIKPIVDGTITIEPEADPSSSSTTTAAAASATPKSPKSPRAARKLVGPSDPRVERAAEWADQYRLDHPECEVQIPALRCWHVWHHSPELDTAGVAALLRDPPLSTVTVAGYIVRAIKKEKFEFDRARLRDEVLVHVHKAILAKHYGVVVKMCDEEILTVGEVAESVGL